MELGPPVRVPTDFAVRDIAFVDENTLVLTDPSANLWRHPIGTRAVTPLASGTDVLADFFDQEAAHTQGNYPRIAASPDGQPVVNSDDMVLLAQDTTGAWRSMLEVWGLYYPHVEFSPDGAYLGAHSEERLVVYDFPAARHRFVARDRVTPTGWRRATAHEVDPLFTRKAAGFTWHPSRPLLLCVSLDLEVEWVDAATGRVAGRPGRVPRADGLDLGINDLALLDDRTIVIAHEAGPVDVWRLDPVRHLESIELDTEPETLAVRPGRSWFAVLTDEHIHFRNIADRAPLGRPVPCPETAWHGLRFSPSGGRLAGVGKDAGLTMWEIRPSGSWPGWTGCRGPRRSPRPSAPR